MEPTQQRSLRRLDTPRLQLVLAPLHPNPLRRIDPLPPTLGRRRAAGRPAALALIAARGSGLLARRALRHRIRRRAGRPRRVAPRRARQREARDRGREDAHVVVPVEPVLAAQVVLHRVREAHAELQRLHLLAPELLRGERRGLAARDVVCRWYRHVHPDEAREVAGLCGG